MLYLSLDRNNHRQQGKENENFATMETICIAHLRILKLYFLNVPYVYLGLQASERHRHLMVDYSPLWETMKKKGISQYHLIKKCGIDNKTIYNIKRNENITLLTLEKLCIALDCTPDDIISFHP